MLQRVRFFNAGLPRMRQRIGSGDPDRMFLGRKSKAARHGSKGASLRGQFFQEKEPGFETAVTAPAGALQERRMADTDAAVSDAEDRIHREVGPLKVNPFKLPDGCVGSYYPEMNPLVALSNHDQQSKTPATKSVPVKILA
jgi:hypothetical protein